VKRAREAGRTLPKAAGAAGRIQYGFHVVDDDLELRRLITGDGPDRPLEGALASLVQRADFPVAATKEDLQIDLALSAARARPSPAHLRTVFKALAAVEGVTLDG